MSSRWLSRSAETDFMKLLSLDSSTEECLLFYIGTDPNNNNNNNNDIPIIYLERHNYVKLSEN